MKWFKHVHLRDILLALGGVFLITLGAAFNNRAGLGNDSIGILYDGLRASMNWTTDQLGMASNIVNASLTVVLFILARKYISIGTLIYFLPYGLFTDINVALYDMIPYHDAFFVRCALCITGNLLLYVGISMYVTVDIGVDPFTGTVLFLRDVTKKAYRTVKIVFDICLVLIGFFLGGKLGVVTVVAAIVAGPIIQFLTGKMQKIYFKKDMETVQHES
ncbi:MAG: DUF6198 family protein [Lachnospiraceae bacterium]|nr:DUF6198 family protein [Lachnospiraceae bacterium]